MVPHLSAHPGRVPVVPRATLGVRSPQGSAGGPTGRGRGSRPFPAEVGQRMEDYLEEFGGLVGRNFRFLWDSLGFC